jgi:drug/metabolite transporter (DMT)-like permease
MDETRTTAAGHHITGILLLEGAVLCFSGIDASAKWLNQSMPSLQTVSLRYLGSFLLALLFLNPATKRGVFRTRRLGLQCARALCLVTATLAGFTAIRYLRISELTTINFASPLIVALLAGPMLGEKIGPRRLVAVLVGFVGVLIVTRPGSGSFQPAALLVVVAALANALYSITTRRLAAHDAPETTMVYTVLVGAVIAAGVLPLVWHAPQGAVTWTVIATIAVCGALGHWLLILAHKRCPASVLAPFYYAQLLSAVVIGAVVFGEVPDRWTLIGGSIVIGSGLYLLYRERVRRKPVPSTDVAA